MNVDEFLADRFAYTFALEEVCQSLEKANKDLVPKPSQIFLPENPFREFSRDMINYGLVVPSRIFVTSQTIEDLDYSDFGEFKEKVKNVVIENRIKLYDQTDYHMELASFSDFVLEQGLPVDASVKNMISNGLKLVITRQNESVQLDLLFVS